MPYRSTENMVILRTLFFLLGLQTTFSDERSFGFGNCGVTEEIPGDIRTKAPWVAGIFVQYSASKPFKFFVTGTIIGPSSVLTVVGGAYGEPTAYGRKYSVPAPEQHKVAVGLPSSDLSAPDEFTQIVEVSNTIPYTMHETENIRYHLFIFQLKTPLNLSTPYARAACIPSNREFIDGEGYSDVWTSFVKAGGFAGPNNDLRASRKDVISVGILLDSSAVCEGEFAERYGPRGGDINYCGRLALGLREKPVCPSYGTAAVGFNNGRWYLLGVLALHQGGRNWCGPSTVFFFSKIVKSLQWIWDFAGTSGDLYPCGKENFIGLSQVCDQKSDCLDARDEDPIYCRGRKPCIHTRKSFECGIYGPCISNNSICDGQIDCPNGEDEDLKTCPLGFKDNAAPKQCPQLETSDGLDLICADKYGERTSCAELNPGTSAHHSCQEFYESTVPGLTKIVRTCLESGNWDPPGNFKCQPECGITDPSNSVPIVVGGEVISTTNAFPWHASIFAVDEEFIKFACGGSLIEKNIVVTAAQCVAEFSREPEIGFLRIVLGANSSDLDSIFTFPVSQSFQVTKVWFPRSYNNLTLISNIALLQLSDDVVFDSFVRPVCYLNSFEKDVPLSGTLGTAPGYGITDDGKVSEYLSYCVYPIVSTFECLASLTRPAPISTFCAGYRNWTSVCQGDIGGGLAFPEQWNGAERYVLKGLLSRKDMAIENDCSAFNFAIFTHVDAYVDWIIDTLKMSRFRKETLE